MKTAVEQLGIAFRQWQKDWDNFNKTVENKPKSYDEFIKPFLEIEKEQIIKAHGIKEKKSSGISNYVYKYSGEEYYNDTYKSE